SVGRAIRSQRIGQGFESPYLHHSYFLAAKLHRRQKFSKVRDRKIMSRPIEIAITGIGVVCPLGWEPESILAGVKANRSCLELTDIGLNEPVYFGGISGAFLETLNAFLDELNEPFGQLARVDPGLLYGMFATHQALNDAGLLLPETLPRDRVGLTSTSSKGFLRCFLEYHTEMQHGAGFRSPTSASATFLRGFFPTTLSEWTSKTYGFTGPCLASSAACATGLVSLILGCQLIEDGVADVVLAGSAECTRNALTLAGFLNMGAFSPHRCLPFHRARSGFNAGEGAAIFVLERLDHAETRGAKPLALVRGMDYRSEAYHITAVEPASTTAEYAVTKTLSQAQWAPSEVEYINAHGTGTPLNDRAEAQLIRKVFGKSAPWVSSLKAHIGHLLGASASVELAVSLIALRAGFIPPTFGLDDPDPECELRFVPADGMRQRVRRFMKFSLGFGGHIATVALEIPE
ncbi:MAG: beta-ketoacyl-[acyl-carrier-protein] synthase family protein, partial [Candidatus Sumerlaeaceae bacterium]|nr:beta-ketoacyl-[acyl-carrier-protein] synthase family protein [Candidatus Sumerlaeaceae bacterium]